MKVQSSDTSVLPATPAAVHQVPTKDAGEGLLAMGEPPTANVSQHSGVESLPLGVVEILRDYLNAEHCRNLGIVDPRVTDLHRAAVARVLPPLNEALTAVRVHIDALRAKERLAGEIDEPYSDEKWWSRAEWARSIKDKVSDADKRILAARDADPTAAAGVDAPWQLQATALVRHAHVTPTPAALPILETLDALEEALVQWREAPNAGDPYLALLDSNKTMLRDALAPAGTEGTTFGRVLAPAQRASTYHKRRKALQRLRERALGQVMHQLAREPGALVAAAAVPGGPVMVIHQPQDPAP